MILKHKILKQLYCVQLINREDNVTIVDVSLNIDALKKRTKANETDLFGALEVLSVNNEVFISWDQNLATITKDGIVSLNNKKYYYEHIRHRRETIIFIIKIFGLIATILTIIISAYKIVNYVIYR